MRKPLGIIASLLIVAAVGVFFYREFQKNIATLSMSDIAFNGFGMLNSLLFTIAAYLLVTYAWRYCLLALSPGTKFSYSESIPAVNIPSMAKYLPGKLWSYAIQMYWLRRSGISKTVVLYTNLLNVFSSLFVSAVVGAIFFMFEPGYLSFDVACALGIALLVFDILFIAFNNHLIQFGLKLIKMIFKRDISFVDTPRSLLFNLQLLYLAIDALFGLGAYFLCKGMGFPVGPEHIFSIISGVAMADSIGFLVFLVPGGLGIREGVMYVVLKSVISEKLALLLPIGNRIIVMTAEILIGLFALYLMRKISGLSLRKLGRTTALATEDLSTPQA